MGKKTSGEMSGEERRVFDRVEERRASGKLVMTDDRSEILGGHFVKVVEWLLLHPEVVNDIRNFVYAYRRFAHPDELLETLRGLALIFDPKPVARDLLQQGLNVFLEIWVESCTQTDFESRELYGALLTFVEKTMPALDANKFKLRFLKARKLAQLAFSSLHDDSDGTDAGEGGGSSSTGGDGGAGHDNDGSSTAGDLAGTGFSGVDGDRVQLRAQQRQFYMNLVAAHEKISAIGGAGGMMSSRGGGSRLHSGPATERGSRIGLSAGNPQRRARLLVSPRNMSAPAAVGGETVKGKYGAAGGASSDGGGGGGDLGSDVVSSKDKDDKVKGNDEKVKDKDNVKDKDTDKDKDEKDKDAKDKSKGKSKSKGKGKGKTDEEKAAEKAAKKLKRRTSMKFDLLLGASSSEDLLELAKNDGGDGGGASSESPVTRSASPASGTPASTTSGKSSSSAPAIPRPSPAPLPAVSSSSSSSSPSKPGVHVVAKARRPSLPNIIDYDRMSDLYDSSPDDSGDEEAVTSGSDTGSGVNNNNKSNSSSRGNSSRGSSRADAKSNKRRRSVTSPPVASVTAPAAAEREMMHVDAPLTELAAFDGWEETKPTQLAEQLVLIDQILFCAIKPVEYLSTVWKLDGGTGRAQAAPALMAATDWFNSLSLWISSMCVMPERTDEQAVNITRFIAVAKRLEKLNDYQGMMCVMSGLNSGAVQRLKRAWAAVKSSDVSTFRALEKLMDSKRNFKNYREKIDPWKKGKEKVKPIIPYLAVFQRDLTFINDGNPDFLQDSSDVINFEKISLMGSLITELQSYVKRPFDNVQVDDHLRTWLLQVRGLESDALFELSLFREPTSAGAMMHTHEWADVQLKPYAQWNSVEVAAWLRAEGLGHVAECVLTYDITGTFLDVVEVTDEVLSQMGVSDIGDRRMFLRVLSRLRDPPTSPKQWSVEDVGSWLKQLNFAELGRKFVKHHVDGSRLLDMGGDEMKSVFGIGDEDIIELLRGQIAFLKLDAGEGGLSAKIGAGKDKDKRNIKSSSKHKSKDKDTSNDTSTDKKDSTHASADADAGKKGADGVDTRAQTDAQRKLGKVLWKVMRKTMGDEYSVLTLSVVPVVVGSKLAKARAQLRKSEAAAAGRGIGGSVASNTSGGGGGGGGDDADPTTDGTEADDDDSSTSSTVDDASNAARARNVYVPRGASPHEMQLLVMAQLRLPAMPRLIHRRTAAATRTTTPTTGPMLFELQRPRDVVRALGMAAKLKPVAMSPGRPPIDDPALAVVPVVEALMPPGTVFNGGGSVISASSTTASAASASASAGNVSSATSASSSLESSRSSTTGGDAAEGSESGESGRSVRSSGRKSRKHKSSK